MKHEKLPTFEEKKKETNYGYTDRQNTKWSEKIARKCNHKWQPLGFENYNVIPDLNKARVHCVCMKCCSYTYLETAWIGYYINSPDLLEGVEDE